MSGIVFGNMLAGLGNGVSGFAGQMARDRAQEEEFRQRMELQQERERAIQERAAATAAARPAAGAGDAPIDLAPGSVQEAMVAANMGKTIPELRQLLGSMRTGDWSPYGQKTETFGRVGVDGQDVSGENSDAVSRGTAKLEKTGETTAFSGDWEKEKREMLARLGRELSGLTYRKDYKTVAEGKAVETDTANRQGIIAGTLDPATVNRASIATKGGKLKENMGEAGTFDVSDGKSELNPLGRAKAADENASAGRNSASAAKDRAEVEKIKADIADGGQAKPQAQERLNSIINSQNATIKSLQDGGRGKTEDEKRAWQARMDVAVQLRDEAQRLLQQSLRERSGQSGAAPVPQPPKSGDNTGIVKSGADRPPSIASIEGAPPGSSIGSFVAGKGWEVKDRSGKVIGHSR